MMIDLTKTRFFASCDPVRVKRIERMVNDKEYMAKHIKRLMLRRARDYRAEYEGELDVVVVDVFESMGEIWSSGKTSNSTMHTILGMYSRSSLCRSSLRRRSSVDTSKATS